MNQPIAWTCAVLLRSWICVHIFVKIQNWQLLMQRKIKLNEKNNIVSTHDFDFINIIFNYLNKYINYNLKQMFSAHTCSLTANEVTP